MAVEMELPFATFTKVEVCGMICVLTVHFKMGKEILQEVKALYGAGCMSKTPVYKWRNMFLCDRKFKMQFQLFFAIVHPILLCQELV